MVVGLVGVLTVAACGGTSGSQNTAKAAAQVLHFPVLQDPGTWDPGELDAEVDSELVQNVFDNLFRYDDKLNLIPDIATQVPTQSNGGISSDGMTYTIHIKHNVTFSDGTPMTADDVLYSWSRSVALNGPYASNLSGIAGYKAVKTAGKAFCSKTADPATCHSTVETKLAGLSTTGHAADPSLELSGVTAPDKYTVQVKLAAGCGWCLSAWSLQGSTGSIVEQKAIAQDPLNWWSHPDGALLIGTGAYKLTSYIAKQSITFKRVSANWWGTPKPTLTEIDIDIKDPSTQPTNDAAWEQGKYDLIGYGGDSQQPTADVLRYQKSSKFSSQLKLIPKGRTTWMSFNIGYPGTGGPFVGESAAALGLRKAFTLAVDKNALVSTVCHNVLCAPATGGLITKGLIGYLGDNTDPLAKFDATTAKSLLHQYDPTGSKTANVKYSYNTGGLNDPVATFLQGQWQTNLGIHVTLDPHPDASAFISDRLGGKFVMSRDGWQFDYNHPQDWFDNLWGADAAGANTSGFADPTGDPMTSTYDDPLAKADSEPLSQALPIYNQLSHLLIDHVAYLPLYYSQGQFLIHPYVHGAGSNAQADYYWDEITILSH
jgi:oligopeptide transport system substrate-binding protein